MSKLDKNTKQLLWILIACVAVVLIFIGMIVVYQKSSVESQYGQGFAEKAALRKHQEEEGETSSHSDNGPGLRESDISKVKGRNYQTY